MQDAPWCDGAYQVFGRVLAGMGAVEAASRAPVGADDAPLAPIVIRDAGEIVIHGHAGGGGIAGGGGGAWRNSGGGAGSGSKSSSSSSSGAQSSSLEAARGRAQEDSAAAAAAPAPTDGASGRLTDEGAVVQGAVTQRVYFDLSRGGADLGRVVVGLYGSAVPGTAFNFAALASGRAPGGRGYAGTRILEVARGALVRAGDVERDDGTGTFTAWGGAGRRFRDEALGAFRHARGAVSMANAGEPDTNGSQFFFALKDLPELDGRNQVFGVVLRGLGALEALSRAPADADGAPLEAVVVRAAGELAVVRRGAGSGGGSGGGSSSRGGHP